MKSIKSFLVLGILLFHCTFSFAAPSRGVNPCILALEALNQLRDRGSLLYQSDRRLKENHLVDFGLCGPTCVFNIGLAIKAKFGDGVKISTDPVKEITDYRKFSTGNVFGDIVVGGTTSVQNAERLFYMLKESNLGLSIGVRNHRSKWKKISVDDIAKPNRLSMIGVAWQIEREAHWLIVKKVDQISKKLYLADPNFPNEPDRVVDYWESEKGIETSFAYPRHALKQSYIQEMVTIDYVTTPPKAGEGLISPYDMTRFQDHLQGKSVRLYLKEGGEPLECVVKRIIPGKYSGMIEVKFGIFNQTLEYSARQMEYIEVLDNQKKPEKASPPLLQLRTPVTISKSENPEPPRPPPPPEPRPVYQIRKIEDGNQLLLLADKEIVLMLKDGSEVQGKIMKKSIRKVGNGAYFTFQYESGFKGDFTLGEIAGQLLE